MRILRNPVAVVVTLGVAIIPSLYAWFNILANWDPYSSTGNLQVAVANEDKGTASDLVGRLDAGKQVVSQLKKNDRLGWTFVSADKAVEGVQSGEYYAAIVLPKDFSESLINSITGSSDKPNIIYYVNEKKNAIAPKITDTGATTIDSQINATFVSTVSKTLAQTMTKEGGKLSQSADGTRTSVVNDLNGLIEQLNDIDSSLGRMGGTFDDAKKGVKQAKSTVASLKRQISSAQKAAKQSQRLLTQVQGSAQSFSSSLAGAFDNGSVQLSGIGVSVNNAAGDALSAFNTAQGSIDDITNALQKPIDGAATLSSDLKDAMNKAGIGRDTAIGKQIWQQIDALDKTVNTQQGQLDAFHKDTSQFISSGKSAATSLSDATSTATGSGIGILNRARTTLTGTVTPNLTAGLSNFATLSGTIDGTLSSLSSTLGQSDSLFDELSDTLSQAKTTVAGTQKSLADLTDSVSGVRTDIAALGSSATYQKIKQALNIDGDSFGEFMGTPVELSTKSVYPMDNYGSAVTPFYTNLALWVGGFVLIAIYKLEVDRERLGDVTASQAYLGRWLLFVVVGFLQALIVMIGDLVLGIQCQRPVLFVLAGLFCSFVYINIIYALAVAFRHIGKAVAVILVIVQIPGASGLYPIEMMPDFFRELHPWLPFTYGINAMRGPIAGLYGNHYWSDMLHLFPVPARRAVHRAGRAPVRAEPERAVRPAAGRNRPDDDRAQRDGQRVGELLFDPERVLEHRRASQGDPPSRETVLRALSAADPRRAGPADRAAVRVPHPAVRHPKQGGDADDVDPVDNHHRCLPDRGRIHAGPVRAAAGRQRHERGRVPRRRAAWIHAPAPDVPHVREVAAQACGRLQGGSGRR